MGEIVGRYVMPHTVNTVPQLGGGREAAAEATVEACDKIAREIAQAKPTTIIVISAHAPSVGNYFYVPLRKRHVGNLLEYNKLSGFMTIPNDVAFVEELARKAESRGLPLTTFNNDPATRRRNRLNGRLDMGTYIPLRFIRRRWADFKLVVVSLSDMPPEKHYECGRVIAQASKTAQGTFAIVASAELSHKTTENSPFGYEPGALAFNQAVSDAFERGAADELLGLDFKRRQKMAQCGVDAITMLMGTCHGYGMRGTLYSYEHPFGVGIITGRLDVGARTDASPAKDASRARSTDRAARRKAESPAVALARRAIDAYLQDGVEIDASDLSVDDGLARPSGVLVSLYKDGRWRGFYGNPDPTEHSAAHDIIDYAITAAIENDIGRLKRSELAETDIVVELVESIEKVDSLDDFDVQKYGMIVKFKETEGVIVACAPGMETVDAQFKAALYNAGASEKDKVRMYRFSTKRYE